MPLTNMTVPRIQVLRGVPLFTGTRSDLKTNSFYELSVCIDDIPATTNKVKIAEIDLIDSSKCMVMEVVASATSATSTFSTLDASYAITYSNSTITQTAIREEPNAATKKLDCSISYLSDNKVGLYISKSNSVTDTLMSTFKIVITISGSPTGSFDSILTKTY